MAVEVFGTVLEGKLRVVIGLLIIAGAVVGLVAEASGTAVAAADLALSAVLVLLLLLATRPGRQPIWLEASSLGLSNLIVLVLMAINDRTMLAGLIFFVIIPASRGLPLAGRVTVYAVAVIGFVANYFLKGIYLIIDPILAVMVVPGIAAMIAFTESSLMQHASAEESRKLLDGLVETQKRLADSEAQEQSRAAKRDIRRAVGGLLADAFVQIEATNGFLPGDPGRAKRLVGKAGEAIHAALAALRDEGRPPQDALGPKPLRILLAHGDQDVSESLSLVLGLEGELTVAARVQDATALVARADPGAFDLALVDEELPPEGGLRAIERLRESRDGLRCLLLSAMPDPELESAARSAGAIGLVDRGEYPAGMAALIKRALRGQASTPNPRAAGEAPTTAKPDLSSRELQILSLIAKGFSNKEIADRLFLAEGTVKNRVSDILQKIGARDRTNAALKARELGLI